MNDDGRVVRNAARKCRRFLRIAAPWFRNMLLNFAGIKRGKSKDTKRDRKNQVTVHENKTKEVTQKN